MVGLRSLLSVCKSRSADVQVVQLFGDQALAHVCRNDHLLFNLEQPRMMGATWLFKLETPSKSLAGDTRFIKDFAQRYRSSLWMHLCFSKPVSPNGRLG